MNNQEPMKQRFKRGRWWKWFGEIAFDDDAPDLGWGRMLPHWRHYKPHSHAYGRKPKWRAKRRLQRRSKEDRKDSVVCFQSHIYAGEDNEFHKKGNSYTVIDCGYHWFKELGYVVWITTEEDKDTKDVDFGLAMSVRDFQRSFWR